MQFPLDFHTTRAIYCFFFWQSTSLFSDEKRRSSMIEMPKRSFFGVFCRLVHTFWQMLYGYWRISRLPEPVVSIFGGSRFPQTDPYTHQAHALASMLINADISVLTGGGAGIMEAANCGAIPTKKGRAQSIGIGVTELGEKPNSCAQEFFQVRYLFARKWLLTRHSVGFVIFPGGFGTLDEFAEILTLVQTKRMPGFPIVLVGKEYWTPLLQWITQEALRHGLILEEHLKLFILTDDLNTVFCTIRDECAVPARGLTRR
jgi:uncharacterized protein (TIGR00730 family)